MYYNNKILIYLKVIIIVSIMAACESSYTPPHEIYKADFDPSAIEEVESLLDEIAKTKDLRLFRKDRNGMKYLSHNKDAFFTCLYYKDNCILSISTVGPATIITIISTDFEQYPITELEILTKEIIKGIQEITGVQFTLEQKNA